MESKIDHDHDFWILDLKFESLSHEIKIVLEAKLIHYYPSLLYSVVELVKCMNKICIQFSYAKVICDLDHFVAIIQTWTRVFKPNLHRVPETVLHSCSTSTQYLTENLSIE